MDKLNQWLDKYCALFPFSGIVRLTQRIRCCFSVASVGQYRLDVPITRKPFSFLFSDQAFLRHRGSAIATAVCCLWTLIVRYLPQTAHMHPDVTIRSLLNHSSGLPDFGESPEFNTTLQFEIPPDKGDSLRVYVISPCICAGTGQSVQLQLRSGSLIVSVWRRAFERFIEDEVFAPLGMKAPRWTRRNGSCRTAPPVTIQRWRSGLRPYTAIEWMMGASGIGTVDDVYCLNTAIKHRLLLSDDSWTQVLTPGHGNYGLGCTVSRWHDRLRYTHNGGHYGFRTLHIQLPEDDLDIIALSNFGFGNFRAAFAEAVRAAIGDAKDAGGAQPRMDPGFATPASEICDPLNPARPAPVALTEQQQEEYVGEYVNDTGSQRISVVFEDGQWSIAFGDGSRRMEVYPCGADSFFHCHIDEKYTFDRDEKGLSFWGMRKQE